MNGKQTVLSEDVFSRGIFAALPRDEWKTLSGFPTPVTFERKTAVFNEGDRATHIYLLHSGLIKTFKTPSHNRTQIVGISGGGDVLGAEALTRSAYQQSAMTITGAVISSVNKEYFLNFMNQKAALSVALIRAMTEEIDRVQTMIVNLGTKKAISRVASCILMFMGKQLGEGISEPFTLPISRQEMGAFLGLSPETVSRQLKMLVGRRLIRLDHKRCEVLSLGQLRALADVS